MKSQNNLSGLVMCGGRSSRMGSDKSKLVYFDKPHVFYLYEMLCQICDKVFISCNSLQSDNLGIEYEIITDSELYKDSGPAAALLSAFDKYPGNDFLAVGCDYPFITQDILENFLSSLTGEKKAAAFYNSDEDLFEPLLARYSASCADLLIDQFGRENYSLQYLLKSVDAEKYIPAEMKCMTNINTHEEYLSVKKELQQ